MDESRGAAREIAHQDPLIGHARFSNGKHISSGTFGSVWVYQLAESGVLVAIKFMERAADVSPYLEAEILNHRVLRHPHIIEFKVCPAQGANMDMHESYLTLAPYAGKVGIC